MTASRLQGPHTAAHAKGIHRYAVEQETPSLASSVVGRRQALAGEWPERGRVRAPQKPARGDTHGVGQQAARRGVGGVRQSAGAFGVSSVRVVEPSGDAVAAGGKLEVVLRNGRRVMVSGEFGAERLARLLDVVEGGA